MVKVSIMKFNIVIWLSLNSNSRLLMNLGDITVLSECSW